MTLSFRALMVPALLALPLLLPPRPAHAACNHAGVTVTGSPADVAAACRALELVRDYFRSIDLALEPAVDIVFSEQVFIDMFTPGGEHAGNRMQVSGYFDVTRHRIEMTTAVSRSRATRRPWKLDWSEEIAHSILLHEIAHMAVYAAMGANSWRLSKTWHEYVASAVQFELMAPATRSRILANYPGLGPFAFIEQVNPILYADDPDAFAVMCHLHAAANGGRSHIRRLLQGDVPFGTGEQLWTR